MRPAALPLLLTLALLSALPAWAQYRWKDANGQVHASDLPPPREVPEKDVLKRPSRDAKPAAPLGTAASPTPARATAATATTAASATPARPASGTVDPELAARRQQAEAQARARAGADEERGAALRADNCQRAREQLARLDTGQRLLRQNAQGEPVVMDEAARNSDAQAARRVMASDCR